MDDWRKAWREHICPQFSADELGVLALALESWVGICRDQTTDPIGIDPYRNLPCAKSCAIGVLAAAKENAYTVGQVEAAFVRVAEKAGTKPTHDFTNWFDSAPAEVVRRELYAEVMLALGTPCHELPPLAPLELVF